MDAQLNRRLLWGIASVFQGVYIVVHRINIPLMIQPQLFGFLSLVSWGQCQYYGNRRPRKTVIYMTGGVLLICALTELSLILGLRQIRDTHTRDIVLTFFGILASVILAVALFPQYWEIYKLQAVVGISLLFLMIDILGGVFFDLSLVFKEEFDVIAGVQYSVVVVFDAVIVLAAGFFKVKGWMTRRKGAADAERELTIESSSTRPPTMSLDTTSHSEVATMHRNIKDESGISQDVKSNV